MLLNALIQRFLGDAIIIGFFAYSLEHKVFMGKSVKDTFLLLGKRPYYYLTTGIVKIGEVYGCRMIMFFFSEQVFCEGSGKKASLRCILPHFCKFEA